MSVAPDPQRRAADPARSAFVTANAGSGKTKTLIDRVARLLLAGAEPETILCVTYTKAAAAEMQRRLYARLGGWSVADDTSLRASLADLEGREATVYDQVDLSKARALFARALETPGGLKIQTIHAFCEKLLRRFPLEAGVSPGFRVMDDPASAAVAAAARKGVALHALRGEGLVAEAYARFSVALDFQSFNAMFAGFEARRGALSAFLEREGGLSGAIAWAWRTCGFGEAEGPEIIEQKAMDALDRELWRGCAEALSQGGAADQKNGRALRAVADDPQAAFDAAMAALFTEKGEGTPATWVAKTGGLKAHEGLRARLLADQDRLAAERERRRGARVAQDTATALVLAQAYLTAYAVEKASAGSLDFTDLVERTCRLLSSRPAAAWVLYKLDGGIDHILLDEAQDTAPDQWTILRALTGEFFVGAGLPRRTEAPRSLFVVGDEKQSIYSFQGADPDRLMIETEAYLATIAAADGDGERVPLTASWRSTVDVLAYVDAVFAAEETREGVRPPKGDAAVRHQPMRAGDRGCVDIWPLLEDAKAEDRGAWDAPLDVESAASANKRLAQAIAAEIEALVARGDSVGGRPADYGDVLILVRKRGVLFEEILRALKHARIPVAGADRLALSAHIVFDDLLALARVALFPADDLTLAAVLKSPFCDLDDDSLYALARGRGDSLWRTLLDRAGERPAWASAAAFLQEVRGLALSQRPFELFSRVLVTRDAAGRSMRARLLRRLGAEAEDALDEFLVQVQAAEARGLHDLEGVAAALAGLDIMVKRELEAGRNEVRVMTAHGAKGLEAPIVFLPETTSQSGARGSPLMETEDGGFLWCASQKADCEPSAAARARRAKKDAEESHRLLYVALTRARERLVLCGKLPGNRREENLKGWWPLLQGAFQHADIQPDTRRLASGDGEFTRYGPDPKPSPRTGRAADPAPALPAWAAADAPVEAFARYASPSTLGEDDKAAAPSPLASARGLGRFRRGDLIHRLLQVLPDLPPGERAAGAEAILAREQGLSVEQIEEMATAALSVLGDSAFAQVFGPGSRAEVAIAGTAAALPPGLAISGRIDRLVVLPDRVLVCDFKTNRPAPRTASETDPAYLRQMALYAAVLGEVFPDRPIEAALVWTDGPKLMPLPENLLTQALAELGRGG
jgi:ATP-dependent helicase/nuclease subunit A